jgi:hypothetical protein
MKAFIRTLCVSMLLICAEFAVADEPNGNSAPEPEIPLSTIVTTSPQKGLLHSRDIFTSKSDPVAASSLGYFRQIQQAIHNGASNVFLVEATSIQNAIRASARIVTGSRGARTVASVDEPNPPRGQKWLVVYLGAGPSEPTWWTVERINVAGKLIRVSYRRSSPMGATRDVNPYYYWIPVGDLETGSYQLELYDASENVVTLMRRVEVEEGSK